MWNFRLTLGEKHKNINANKAKRNVNRGFQTQKLNIKLVSKNPYIGFLVV
jgi:hypothetical protein